LIFFLTIHDSRALNGPVATDDQLVNREHSIASGSTRFHAAEASRIPARSRSGVSYLAAVLAAEFDRSGHARTERLNRTIDAHQPFSIFFRRGSDSKMKQPQ
jgi:hypothetical protein